MVYEAIMLEWELSILLNWIPRKLQKQQQIDFQFAHLVAFEIDTYEDPERYLLSKHGHKLVQEGINKSVA